MRHDIYRKIHKALRTCMADTMVKLGRLDCSNQEEVADVLAQSRSMANFMANHLSHEDRFIHPHLESRLPGSTKRTANEHEEHDQACSRIISLASAAEHASADELPNLIHQLYMYVAYFMAESLVHMDMEETDNNTVLQATHSDKELMAMEMQIVASLSERERAMSMRWMLEALTPQELAPMQALARLAA